MATKQCCRLCRTACDEYELLQNEMGYSNEIYEITVKYFDPMLLEVDRNSKDGKEMNVLCHDCWLHISNFQEFQQTVFMARNSLEKYNIIRQLEIEVKQEREEDIKAEVDNSDVDRSVECDYKRNYEKDNENSSQRKTTVSYEDDDDGKPLITLRKSAKGQDAIDEKKINEKTNPANDNNKLKEITKSRKRRIQKIHVMNDFKAENLPCNRKKLKLLVDTKEDFSDYIKKGMESDNFITEWKPELECDICSETCKSFQQLTQHFKEKHKTKGYIKCCNRKFYRRNVLVDHVRLHLNPDVNKCDICGKHISSQYYLKIHKKIMHKNTEPFECEQCHKILNHKQSLDRHMQTHCKGSPQFVCKECGKVYVLEDELKSHIKKAHNRDCGQCGKTVHSVAALKKHLIEHGGVKKPKFPCNKCNVVLNSRNSLNRHISAFHHDGSTIYVCGICSKVSASKNALLSHKRYVHAEIRKHKCSFCDKAFKRPNALRGHIATHTGQDLYQCPHCPKTFKASDNMYYHRKTAHTIEWEEGKKNRLQLPKVNINQVKYKVVV